MNPKPKIDVPAGYDLIERPDGTYAIEKRKSADHLRKTISFRVSGGEYASLKSFVESFPQRQWGAAVRWLLMDERVQAVMRERIQSQTRPRREP